MDDEDESLMPEHKKTKIYEKALRAVRQSRCRNISEILQLMGLTTSSKRTELLSNYVTKISEFILHEAEKLCKIDKRNRISVNDIKNVIASEDLFFLLDLLYLHKKN